MLRTYCFPPLALLPIVALLWGCPGPSPSTDPPILEPEPPGSPSASAEGRLSCLGTPPPLPSLGTELRVAGYVRALSDATNTTAAQPVAEVEAFDATGPLTTTTSLAMDGRAILTIPIGSTGFEGWVRVSAAGFVPTSLYSSRAYTSDVVAGWVWLPTPTEVTDHASLAGATLTPGQGTLVGSVHDCDLFGIANAVVVYAGRSDGVIYYQDFTPDSALTFTGASGRFAVANVPPGPTTVEAYGRLTVGAPLTLLSHAEVSITADEVTSVDLRPRTGVDH